MVDYKKKPKKTKEAIIETTATKTEAEAVIVNDLVESTTIDIPENMGVADEVAPIVKKKHRTWKKFAATNEKVVEDIRKTAPSAPKTYVSTIVKKTRKVSDNAVVGIPVNNKEKIQLSLFDTHDKKVAGITKADADKFSLANKIVADPASNIKRLLPESQTDETYSADDIVAIATSN